MTCKPAACADCDPVVLERRRQSSRNLPTGTYPRCEGCQKRDDEFWAKWGHVIFPMLDGGDGRAQEGTER